jgi:hypothetical protein
MLDFVFLRWAGLMETEADELQSFLRKTNKKNKNV